MDIKIMWRNGTKWLDFDYPDIAHLSRNHAINLFSFKTPVLIKAGDTYISNDKAVRAQYHKRGDKIIALDTLARSESPLSEVGFI